jgi:hypothetical protein
MKFANFPVKSVHLSADVTFQRLEQNETFSHKVESTQEIIFCLCYHKITRHEAG